MEVTNLLDIHTREDLYAWYLENHEKVSDFWLRINRAREPFPGVVGYVDAVEVALCFGWIDSTQKRIDDGKPIQHFTPRRKRSNWCWNNIERCRRLIDLGEMTPAGLAVLPDHDPKNFVFEECKKQVFDQQFSEKLDSADFGKLVLHVVIDKAVMRQRAAASLLGA